MTEKVFHKNLYLKSLDTSVVDVINGENRCEIILDKSIFFPEGGGQPGDRGYIKLRGNSTENIEIYDTHEKGDVITHYIKGNECTLKPGDEVTITLDWDFRFTNMQRHYGEHILSGAIYKLYKGDNKGFHMGENYITIDIDLGGKIMDTGMLMASETLANEAVWANLPIKGFVFASTTEANKMPLRKPINDKIEGETTVVTVGNPEDPFDCCACCGTYPSFSGEIGLIKIYKAEPNKGMTRIYFDCGKKALKHCQENLSILDAVAERFSAKPQDLIHSLDKRDTHEAQLKSERGQFADYVRAREEQILNNEIVSTKDKLLYKEYKLLDPNDLLKIGSKALKASGHNNILLALFNKEANTLMLISDGSIKCDQLVKDFASKFGGKGGGRYDNARAMFSSFDEAMKFINEIKENIQ